MVAYCLHKFMLDEDTSTIEFHSFNGKGDNIYPTLSLCFRGKGIFDQALIRRKTKSQLSYSSFLDGQDWDNRLLEIDYDNVSLDARKMVEYIRMYPSNYDRKPIFKYQRNGRGKRFPFQESLKSADTKCYSLDLNVDTIPELETNQLSKISLTIENYYRGVKHFVKQISNHLSLDVFVTYPNQLLRSHPVMKLRRINERKGVNITQINLYGMDIVQKRSKAKDACKINWTEDDHDIIRELTSKVGCRHKHWMVENNLPVCQTKGELAALKLPQIYYVDKKFLGHYIQPCRKIQTVIGMNTIAEAKYGNIEEKHKNGSSLTKLVIHFKEVEYKLIRNVKSFNEESLIGNLGGYFGLFLGFAIWQLPSFFEPLLNKYFLERTTYKE